MKSTSIFKSSLAIALNRSALQIASIVITAILGLYSTQVLAEFSLALTFASIFFVLVSSIQMGIQSEFGKRFAEKDFVSANEIFNSTAVIIFILSCLLLGGIWLSPSPFTSRNVEFAFNAHEALKILAFSLPLVGLLTNITYFLESVGYIKGVTRLRIWQVVLQVGLIFVVVAGKDLGFIEGNLTSKDIAVMYVLSDAIMLLYGFYLYKVCMKQHLPVLSYQRKPLFRIAPVIDVIKLGFPVMLGMIGQKCVFYFYANIVAGIGVIEVSAFSIVNSVVYFFQIPLLGVSHLLTIKISQARGEKSFIKINEMSSKCMMLFFVEVIAITSFMLILLPWVLKLFTHDSDVTQMLNTLSVPIMIYFLMNVMLTFGMSSLRGYSDTFIPQLTTITSLGLGIIACYLISYTQLDLGGVFWIFSISGFIASFFLLRRANKHKEKAKLNFGLAVKY